MSIFSRQPQICCQYFTLHIVYFLVLIVLTTCLEFLPSKTPSDLEPKQTSTRLPYSSAPPGYPDPFPSELRVRPRFITAGPVIGYIYHGCWVDNSDTRVLAVERFDYTALDPAICGNFCALVGCSIFGVENSSECYCDNTMATTSTASPMDCSMTCAENSDDECGGFSRINIYSATTALSAVIGLGTNTALPLSSTTTLSSPPYESSSLASNGGSAVLTVAGIAIGSAAAGALVCSAIFLLFYRRHRGPPAVATNASESYLSEANQIAEIYGQDAGEIRQTSTLGNPGSSTISGGNLYRQVHEMEVPKTQ